MVDTWAAFTLRETTKEWLRQHNNDGANVFAWVLGHCLNDACSCAQEGVSSVDAEHIAAVTVLLRKGANVEFRDYFGWTRLLRGPQNPDTPLLLECC